MDTRHQIDGDEADGRMRTIAHALYLANRSTRAAAASWALAAAGVAWICISLYLHGRLEGAPGHPLIMLASGAILVLIGVVEWRRVREIGAAPTRHARTCLRLQVVSIATGAVITAVSRAGLISPPYAASAAFLLVGLVTAIIGRTLPIPRSLFWLSVVPWGAASALSPNSPEPELLLLTACTCIVGGLIPGLLLSLRPVDGALLRHGSDRQSNRKAG